jgi:hypothetical protein
MAKIIKDKVTGQTHEFPDDATSQEIESAMNSISPISENNNQSSQPSNILDHLKNILTSAKPDFIGENVGSGLMSNFFKTPEEKNLVKNIPQIATGVNLPTTTQKISQGVGEMLPQLMPAGAGSAKAIPKIGEEIAEFTTGASTKRSMITDILKGHDNLEEKASKDFIDVSTQAKNRGISKISLNEKDISSLKKYFPKTEASKDLLNSAKSGDYDALRDLQSDMYTRGKNALSSDLIADQNLGEEMLEKRDKINKLISEHLKNTGNIDLAEKLNGARNDWHTLQDTFYNKELPASIRKLVNNDTRKIPKNIATVLSEESKPISKLKDFIPGIDEKLKYVNSRKNVTKNISTALKIGIPSAALYGGAYEGTKYYGNNEE